MSDNVVLNAGAGGDTIAADDIGGFKHQRIKLIHGVDGVNDGDTSRTNPFPVTPFGSSRSDTYTTAADGTAVDISLMPCKYYGLQVTQTGTVTSWTVELQVSLDGVTYTTILSHTKAGDTDGITVWAPQPIPGRFFRTKCTAITLGGGTNVVARCIGMN